MLPIEAGDPHAPSRTQCPPVVILASMQVFIQWIAGDPFPVLHRIRRIFFPPTLFGLTPPAFILLSKDNRGCDYALCILVVPSLTFDSSARTHQTYLNLAASD